MSRIVESLYQKYGLNESYSTNGITLDKMKSDIQKAKNRLKKKKSHENFGQNEVRKIADKYSSLQLDYYSDYNKLMNDFIDWCATVELNEDYGEDKYSLVGQDGNAFALMGYTSRCMKECGLRDEVDEMIDRATESNYDNLIMVCDEYIQRCNDIARDGFEESLSLTESLTKKYDKLFENDLRKEAPELFKESLSTNKIMGKTWKEFISNIENETEYSVDSAYKNHPDNWIILIDDKGNMYDAEVTQYYEGDYELMLYNITPRR